MSRATKRHKKHIGDNKENHVFIIRQHLLFVDFVPFVALLVLPDKPLLPALP